MSFLYLASDQDTALAEVRPYKSARVTVAMFRIDQEVRIADLTSIRPLRSPFGVDDVQLELEKRWLLDTLSIEFATPIEPAREIVDYVPTQFAAEVIRAEGYQGIVYTSAMASGKNLVLFDAGLAKAVKPRLLKVRDISYDSEPVPAPPVFPNLGS